MGIFEAAQRELLLEAMAAEGTAGCVRVSEKQEVTIARKESPDSDRSIVRGTTQVRRSAESVLAVVVDKARI